jgi:hypothetical protein
MLTTLGRAAARLALAIKGYIFLRRSWHCAWVMAERK